MAVKKLGIGDPTLENHYDMINLLREFRREVWVSFFYFVLIVSLLISCVVALFNSFPQVRGIIIAFLHKSLLHYFGISIIYSSLLIILILTIIIGVFTTWKFAQLHEKGGRSRNELGVPNQGSHQHY